MKLYINHFCVLLIAMLLIPAATLRAQITIVSPASGASIPRGSNLSVNFQASANLTSGVAEVYRGATLVGYLPNVQRYTWYNFSTTSYTAGSDYRVKVYDSSNPTNVGWTGYFSIINIPAPVLTAATSVANVAFTVNWGAVSGATSYQLDVSTVSDFSSFVSGYQNLSVAGTNAGVYTNITGSTQYYYRVRAVNSYGASPNSTPGSVLTTPPTPVLSAHTPHASTSFTANWSTVAGATEYRLDVSTTNTFTTNITGYNNLLVAGTSAVVSGLTPNVQYFYRVRAVNATGGSNSGPKNFIGILFTAPTAPLTVRSGTSFNFSYAAPPISTGSTAITYAIYKGATLLSSANYRYPVTTYEISTVGFVAGSDYKLITYDASNPAFYGALEFSVYNDYSYIKSSTVLKAGVTTLPGVTSLPITEQSVQTTYVDGMGRPLQSVTWKGSPMQTDIVQPVDYDVFGRQEKSYLPYAAGTNGGIQENALREPSSTGTGEQQYQTGAQYQFYQQGGTIAMDGVPYSKTIFEPSPLGRTEKQYGPGAAWAASGNNKYIENQYRINSHGTGSSATQEKVIAWEVNGAGMPVRSAIVTNYIVTGGYYSSGQLSVAVTLDEEGHAVRQYTNREGRVILKKVQAGTSITNLNSTTDWALTYYVYDDAGNLRYVFPPELSKLLHTNADSYTITSTDLNNWAFLYTYDHRNRMITKQVPGAGAVYMVYDKRDRVVLTQDAVQRVSNYWTFTKYDLMNRPILTGIKDTTVVSQSVMQGVVDAWYDPAKPWRTYGETFTGTGAVHGYSNTSYPKTTSSGTLDVNRYLTVTYFDNYAFKALWSSSYNYVDENLSQTVSGITYNQPDVARTSIKLKATGSKMKVLDGGITGGATWLKSVSYYDDDYRVIQTISDNYKQGTDRISNLYDFAGKTLKTQSSHSEYDLVWKDVTSGVAKAGERLFRSTGGSDNSQGAASVAMLPASTDGWFEFTHSNTNTLYIGLSDANPDTSPTSIDYGVRLGGSSYAVFMGAGALTTIGTHALGDVIRFERTAGIIKVKRNGVDEHTFPGTSTAALMVDISFNSGQSSVLFARSSFTASAHTVVRTFDYDHAGRLLNTWHQLNNGPLILLSKSEYNALGQLIDKKLHSTVANGSDARQSVDYRYNIRGWMTAMNDAALSDNAEAKHDLFGMELGYNNALGMSNTSLYNGNISGVKWSNNLGLGTVKENAYTYSYDALNRLTGSVYNQNNGTWTALGDSRNAESGFVYDLNGNITALKRNDNRTSGLKMDDLVYDYGTSTARSNKLLKVTDNGDDYKGFMDGTNGGNDYSYDANGNMTLDYNKGISTAITYNYLNLPEAVTRGGGTNTVRYIYDAAGRKLAQVVALTGTLKQTDYSGEYVYENDVLQFVSHEEGRIVVAQEERIFAFDGSHTNGITPTANVSLTNETQGEETYLKVTAAAGTALTKRGITPVGGSFPVMAGERYVYRVKGYRSGETVNLYVKGNSSDMLWPAAQLTPGVGHKNDVWVETFFTIPAGITSIELGVLWNSSATTTQFFYVNELELVKLGSQAPEYQYNLKDHLGNVRLTFTSKDEIKTGTATLETANSSAEQSEFIYYSEAVKINSTLFDHTSSGSTNYATRLTGSAAERYGLAKSISVMPGDVVRATVYAKYLDTNSGNWTTPLANFMAAIANGSAPVGTVVDGGLTGSTGGATPSFASLLSKGSETGTAPKAYLNYLVFDRNFVFRTGGFIRMTTAAREYGQDGAHEQLFKELTITEPGYVYLYLSNDTYALGGPLTEVYFDDFTVEHEKSPVVQSDDYYAFGMNFNSYQRENSKGNNFLYNGKEKQDELGLDWLDYGARMYMPEIGRWGVVDLHADSYYMYSPYNYAVNNPINVIDPDGNDIYLLTWFSKQGETGHAGIAIDNYKTQNKKDAQGNDVRDDDGNIVTEQVKDGTFTYFDLWPKDGVGKTEGQDNVASDYSNGIQINSLSDLMTKDPTGQRSGNVSAEGRAADGIVKVTTTAAQDATAKSTAEQDIKSGKAYNGCYNNCSTFAQRILNSALPNKINANQPIRPEKALQVWPFSYKDAQTVAPNNLYNAALKIKGATNVKGPKSVPAKPYLEYMGQRNRP